MGIPYSKDICPEDIKLAVKLNDAYSVPLNNRESVAIRVRDVLQKKSLTELAVPGSVSIRYPDQFLQRAYTYIPGGEAYAEVCNYVSS